MPGEPPRVQPSRINPENWALTDGELRARWTGRSRGCCAPAGSMRLPIPLYRASLGWMLGSRLVMIEHLGRVSGERRFAVVEVLSQERNVVRVASGLGRQAAVVPQHPRPTASPTSASGASAGSRPTRGCSGPRTPRRGSPTTRGRIPTTWRHLHAAMDVAQGRDADIPVIEFVPPRDPSALEGD